MITRKVVEIVLPVFFTISGRGHLFAPHIIPVWARRSAGAQKSFLFVGGRHASAP
jgi:hypothetical protein